MNTDEYIKGENAQFENEIFHLLRLNISSVPYYFLSRLAKEITLKHTTYEHELLRHMLRDMNREKVLEKESEE